MSEFNITVEGGSSVRLPTAGKYCDRDILVTATGGGGTTPANPVIEPLSVTENGTYTAPNGVDGYSPIEVNVPIPDGYIKPSGTLSIEENGTHDVTDKASVSVNVPIPEGYIQPSGTLEVTENGTHDVTEYASVTVNVAGSGGGDPNALLDAILNNTLTAIDSNVTSIVGYACRGLTKLTTVNLPNATSIGTYAFYGCTQLKSVSFPNVTALSEYTFRGCSRLTSIDLPELTTCGDNEFYGTAAPTLYLPKLTNCTTYTFSTMKTSKVILPAMKAIGSNAFRGASIVTADLAVCTNIAANGFQQCASFEHLILRSESVCTLANTSAFASTKIAKGTGYIYVPRTLADGSDGVATYQVATNWSTYASQFRAIEDYPDICGG
jgi:hypothetical protein